MLSLQIKDLKKFTALLFTEDAFDKFLLHDAQFVTAQTITIQGRKNEEFYTEEEKETELKILYPTYADYRNLCFSFIKGKRLPVSFRIVLLTDPNVTEHLRKKADFSACPVSSLSINISFKENQLFVTTGVSYGGFSLDKSLEKHWDDTVLQFIEGKEISYEIL